MIEPSQTSHGNISNARIFDANKNWIFHFDLKFQISFCLSLKTQKFYSPNPKSLNWFSKSSKPHATQYDYLL